MGMPSIPSGSSGSPSVYGNEDSQNLDTNVSLANSESYINNGKQGGAPSSKSLYDRGVAKAPDTGNASVINESSRKAKPDSATLKSARNIIEKNKLVSAYDQLKNLKSAVKGKESSFTESDNIIVKMKLKNGDIITLIPQEEGSLSDLSSNERKVLLNDIKEALKALDNNLNGDFESVEDIDEQLSSLMTSWMNSDTAKSDTSMTKEEAQEIWDENIELIYNEVTVIGPLRIQQEDEEDNDAAAEAAQSKSASGISGDDLDKVNDGDLGKVNDDDGLDDVNGDNDDDDDDNLK